MADSRRSAPLRATILLVAFTFAPPLVAQAPAGALAGKRVVLSPGHGYYWHSSLGWTTQRPLIDGLIEDIHTNEIVMDWVTPLLERAGARVIPCRARSRTTEEHVLDNDDGPPTYQEFGTWSTSASTGWNGGTYRFAAATSAGGSRAEFRTTVNSTDEFPVYVAYRSGSNRTAAARIEITHAAGTSVRFVDQRSDGLRWVYVGTFPFRSGEEAVIALDSQTTSAGVIIADAVRIGDGMGSIVRGGTTSGRPRWQECSRYHAEYFGAPPSVWDPVAGGQDNSDDVTTRPHYAEWWGADVYVSLHTNAGGGSGTSTWIHNTSPTPGSATLQALVQNQIINDLRAEWDPAWQDDGLQSANFGEVRELVTMPGCLIELAFHDDIGGDIEAIHHPRFRKIAGRAIYRAIAAYLAPGVPFTLEPPQSLAMRNDGMGNLVLSWAPVAGATSYLVRQSSDGFAFDDGQVVTGTSLTLGGLPHDALRFAKVAAINAGGTGMDSELVGARLAPGGTAPLLLVQGFDRHDRFVKELENRHDGIAIDGGAIDAVLAAGYPFDGCTNEAVAGGLVPLAPYTCVGWILGEESTVDETFSAVEQNRVIQYLLFGGNLFFSGAEVGWDLDAQGSPVDRFFYQSQLGQDYVADDAGTYFTQATSGGPLGTLPAMMFGNGVVGPYDVDYPDVVQPSAAGGGQIVLRYATGAGAGVLHGNGRVLGLGFPIEALVNPADRELLIERILALLCPLPVEPNGPVLAGASNVIDVAFPDWPSATYLAGAAFSDEPGIPTGDGRWVPLAPDALFLTLMQPQPFFAGLVGMLDPSGTAQVTLQAPALPFVSGLSFVMSAVAVDGSGQIAEIAPWRRITIQ